MIEGTVKFFSAEKGYGFINPDGEPGLDIFVHHSNILMEGFRALQPGQRVQFQQRDGEKGLYAVDVLALD